jgi:hypothetical protein
MKFVHVHAPSRGTHMTIGYTTDKAGEMEVTVFKFPKGKQFNRAVGRAAVTGRRAKGKSFTWLLEKVQTDAEAAIMAADSFLHDGAS